MQENVKYDGAIRVATTKSRKSTDYKNKQFKWSALLNQLKTVERSGETYAEYMALPKQTQDALKDRGGYVGGYLQNGRRKNENLAFRSLITLDIDHATDAVEVWEDFQMLYGKAAAIHSTRKHCAEKPRLLLLGALRVCWVLIISTIRPLSRHA